MTDSEGLYYCNDIQEISKGWRFEVGRWEIPEHMKQHYKIINFVKIKRNDFLKGKHF